MPNFNNALQINGISGIKELNDDHASKYSGGYVAKLYYGNRQLLSDDVIGDLRFNIAGDPNKNPDFKYERRAGADEIGLVGADGAKYKVEYYPNQLFGESKTLEVTTKGWANSQEVFATLDAPQGFTGLTIDRIS